MHNTYLRFCFSTSTSNSTHCSTYSLPHCDWIRVSTHKYRTPHGIATREANVRIFYRCVVSCRQGRKHWIGAAWRRCCVQNGLQAILYFDPFLAHFRQALQPQRGPTPKMQLASLSHRESGLYCLMMGKCTCQFEKQCRSRSNVNKYRRKDMQPIFADLRAMTKARRRNPAQLLWSHTTST